MAECKYCVHEMCVNDDCPLSADYCPVPDVPDVCKFEERSEKKTGMTKPPLGVSPHWFMYRRRIEELHEAIGRYLEHIETHQHTEHHEQYYKLIALWAKEIELLALMEAEVEEMEKRVKV